MRRFCISNLLLALSFVVHGQQDSIVEKELDEVIIYSGKFAEHRRNVAQNVEVITATQVERSNSQNTGDLLMKSGSLFVQKSQQGGSSPVIRGFEASRVLLVVDGIRMNNAIYRAGHLQNIITVDQNMLERVEIMYGPASTMYGSDALGGAILMRTKMPVLSQMKSITSTGSAFIRYSSANNEKTGHFDISVGNQKLAWLQSYNYSYFGDMKMGDHYPDKYPDFGRRSQYITTINGIDSIVANADDRVQKFSGYKQWDITQKLLWKQSGKVTHLLNLQLSNSTDVPRYDRLQDLRNGILRYAEWFYGPQKRNLAAYELNINKAGFFNEVKATLSYQHIEESRHTREYRRYDRFDHRMEKVEVWGFTIDGRKLWKQNEITIGLDGQLNGIRSTAYRENKNTGTTSKLDTRYPNGKNKMNYFALYAQHLLKLKNGKIILNDGLRLQAVNQYATITDNSFFNFPFTEMKRDNFSLTGNAGLVFLLSQKWKMTTNASTGFRVPNFDDAAKIFESDATNRKLVVPNPNLKPEYTYNVDLGIAGRLTPGTRLEFSSFYTWFRNAITLAPYQWKGSDSIDYSGVLSKTFANQNTNKAYLYGGNTNVTIDITKQWQLFSTFTYTYGRMLKNKTTKVPLDHIPPVYGKTRISYTAKKCSMEAYALYNGWKKIEDYNPDGEDNAQYATPDGMPAWFTLNFSSSIELTKMFLLQLGVENILDRNYRHFASGFSASGRNFIIALRSKF